MRLRGAAPPNLAARGFSRNGPWIVSCHSFNRIEGMPDNQEQQQPGFESSLGELETVVKQLESGDLPLEKALELFEKGMRLSEACRKQLEEAETKVELLTRRGNAVVPEPFK